jgi:hypothetical protein
MSAPVVEANIRARAVQAFHGAGAAAHATGDRRMQELLHQLAVELGHHDTTDETLAGVMQAFADTTTGGGS